MGEDFDRRIEELQQSFSEPPRKRSFVNWRMVVRLSVVVIVMAIAVGAVAYYQQSTSRCDGIRDKIFNQSYTPISEDSVRILSIETIREVREGIVPSRDSFRCVGIVVTNKGLSWFIFNQTRHVGTDMTSWGYVLTDANPIK